MKIFALFFICLFSVAASAQVYQCSCTDKDGVLAKGQYNTETLSEAKKNFKKDENCKPGTVVCSEANSDAYLN